MEYLRSYNADVNSALGPLDNPAVAGFLKLFLVMYGGMVAPHLPPSVLQWFQYPAFKIAVLFLILWTGSRDPSMAILISTVFYTSLNVLSGKKAFEAFQETPSQDQYYH